eukprot:1555224-Pyramimonas_sp.AAC.1
MRLRRHPKKRGLSFLPHGAPGPRFFFDSVAELALSLRGWLLHQMSCALQLTAAQWNAQLRRRSATTPPILVNQL